MIGWLGILRLGLVQTALGAIVVLTTSAINRVMVVELGLPATIPGLLVALHYAMQLMRPAMGYGSDTGGRRTPWIIGGVGVLGLGGIGAALAAVLEERTGRESRAVVLGHVQRGGTPSAFDRVLATRFGLAAVDAVQAGLSGGMVALRGTDVVPVPIAEATAKLKLVPLERYAEAEVFFG